MPDTTPPARPAFRSLAFVAAATCLVLAGLTPLAFAPGDRVVPAVIFLFVAVVMAAVASTGYWPPRRPG